MNPIAALADENARFVALLRERVCPAGLPHTGDEPQEDHGHTDCWLHHQSISEIERLRAECQKLANLLMSPLVFTHERILDEVDAALLPYLGRANSEARQQIVDL
jgi:hypothetical protein